MRSPAPLRYGMLSPMKRLLLLFITAALAFAADLTGTWEFNVETDMGFGTPIMTFKQDGNKLTGTYKGQLGEAPLQGTVNGEKRSEEHTSELQSLRHLVCRLLL